MRSMMNKAVLETTSLLNIVSQGRLSLFGGKGGVGKTTIAASMAVELARLHPQREVLLLSLDPSHSLSSMLDRELSRCLDSSRFSGSFNFFSCTRLFNELPNLCVCELEFSRLADGFKDEYGLSIEKLVEQGTLLNDSDIKAFVNVSMPALGELMALMEMTQLLKSNARANVIIDAAPTGHTLRLLELPEFLQYLSAILVLMDERHQLVSSSLVGRQLPVTGEETVLKRLSACASELKELLSENRKTGVFVVTLAEHLPLAETADLVADIYQKHIPIKAVVINKMAARNCSFCADTARRQSRYLAQVLIDYAQFPCFAVPLTVTEPRTIDALVDLAASFSPLQVTDPSYRSEPPEAQAIASDGPGTTEWHTLNEPPRPRSMASDDGLMPDVTVDGKLPDYVEKGFNLVIFAGKGGVGKTSISAASALVLAQRHPDKRLLIASIDPAHSLGDSMGEPLGHKPRTITPNLWAAEADAKILLAQFKAIYRAEVNDFLRGLLPAAGNSQGGVSFSHDEQITEKLLNLETPDLDEFMVFRWLTDLERSGRFDIVLLDPAPAGHLLRFFELPAMAKAWIKAFLTVINKHNAMEKTQQTVRELLALMKSITFFEDQISNAEKAALVAVATPNQIVFSGMFDMIDRLGAHGIKPDSIVINLLRKDSSRCRFCHELHCTQCKEIGLMSRHFSNLNLVRITQASSEILGKPSLIFLGERLYG